jgi:FixJ family two-component response regulator
MLPEEAASVVHIVEDDEALRRALRRLLEQAGYAVREYPGAGDFMLAPPDARPGCLLLDLELAGPSGLDLQQALIRERSALPIVFMSAYTDVPRTVQAIQRGARDFLVKPIPRQTLLAAIESALAAGSAMRARPAPTLAAGDAPPLTERERTVLAQVVAGRLNRQIGEDLHLSERTIKACRAELMRKLGAHSLAELVRIAGPLLDP